MKKVFNSFSVIALFVAVSITTQSFTFSAAKNTPSVISAFEVPSSPLSEIMVPAGTSVSVRLHGNYHSDDYEIGNTIKFIVSDPVIVDGQVVIAQGAPAEGEITSLKRMDSCSDCASQFQSIEIMVTRAKAVDGSYVNLYGKPHAVRGKCPSCPVVLNQGVHVEATVQSTTRIKVR
jgi:hypothetical protein